MTNTEADNLIASLPKPGRLRLFRKGDWIMMSGGKHGEHSIAVRPSSAERLLVHWRGYVKNQGLDVGRQLDAALGGVSALARAAHEALCTSKSRSLTRGSLARKIGVGRWKRHSHASLDEALHELARIGLVTSDGYARYTATCDEDAR